MTTFASDGPAASTAPMGWLARAEHWLDSKGKTAWIAAMVLGFVLFWPIGLALLGYMIWSGKMACKNKRMARNLHVSHGTGNSAFDAYKTDTLRRLEEEQENFEAFLQRLRDARDKAEFDQFMEDRARAASAPDAGEDAQKA